MINCLIKILKIEKGIIKINSQDINLMDDEEVRNKIVNYLIK
jgi:hypothetical protein